MFDLYMLPFLLIPLVVIILIVVGIISFVNNHNRNANNMDSNQMSSKTSAQDVLLNLGAFIGLYTLVYSLLNLLFTIINTVYPQINSGYNYAPGSQSISWPVATLIVFFPIFVLLMWFLEREYKSEPEKQSSIIHKGFTYITLLISGLVIAGDLIAVIYYFIDGQELTLGFLLKVLVLFIISSSLFFYFISDLRGKLTAKWRMIWRFISGFIILSSIIWGFMVLGSPHTQRLYKYDEQKINDLQNINSAVQNYYYNKNVLPKALADFSDSDYSSFNVNDSQTGKPYEYEKLTDTSYKVCAEFNKATSNSKVSENYPYLRPISYGNTSWTHSAGHYCFTETMTPNSNTYPPKPLPVSY